MTEILVFINGQRISNEQINRWELTRLVHEYHFLKKVGIKFEGDFPDSLNLANLKQARIAMGRAKAAYPPETFREILRRKTALGNFASRLAIALSRGKRKFSITELLVPKSQLSAREVMTAIQQIMLVNSIEHLQVNLSAAPDHFVLLSPDPNVQEVLEITGGSPLPNRFFAHYGDEKGLKSTFDPDFVAQAAGTARLGDGTIIGGVRHQIKPEGNGFRFRALVEFPAVLPNYMIRQHQLHLACEFSNWINAVL